MSNATSDHFLVWSLSGTAESVLTFSSAGFGSNPTSYLTAELTTENSNRCVSL